MILVNPCSLPIVRSLLAGLTCKIASKIPGYLTRLFLFSVLEIVRPNLNPHLECSQTESPGEVRVFQPTSPQEEIKPLGRAFFFAVQKSQTTVNYDIRFQEWAHLRAVASSG